VTNYDKRRLLKALRIAVAAAQSNGVDPWTLRVPLAVLSDAPDEPFSELPQLDDGAAAGAESDGVNVAKV
jgi:hypothetical protein